MLTLVVLGGSYSICRLPPAAQVPSWIGSRNDFLSINRTRDELSIVSRSDLVPSNIELRSDGWRCLKFEGKFNFDETGILASVLSPLAASQISVLTFGTFDTDYLLIREVDLARALDVLTAAGHQAYIEHPQSPRGRATD